MQPSDELNLVQMLGLLAGGADITNLRSASDLIDNSKDRTPVESRGAIDAELLDRANGDCDGST